MNKLTCLEDLPRPRPGVVGHNYRSLRDDILLTDDAGRYLFLKPEEYRDYVSGKAAPAGFLRPMDRDVMARAELRASLLSWPGPWAHRIFLRRARRGMDLETAQKAVDFMFTVPGSGLNIELVGGEAQWPSLWFIAQYARRKSEWTGRPARLRVRWEGPGPQPAKFEFLQSQSIDLEAVVNIQGRPRKDSLPFPVQRARCFAQAAASHCEAWADLFEKSSLEWILLSPAPSLMTEKGLPKFLRFYAELFPRLLQGGIREERAAAFLSGKRWMLPGQDVLGELAYAPDGRVYTGETGMDMGGQGMGGFYLGILGELDYDALAKKEVVRAVLAAAHGDAQPLCFQCVYKPYCSISPALNMRDQGSVWGQTPSSLACSLHMGMLDVIFANLKDEKTRAVLEGWV